MLSILSYISGPSVCPPWRSVCSWNTLNLILKPVFLNSVLLCFQMELSKLQYVTSIVIVLHMISIYTVFFQLPTLLFPHKYSSKLFVSNWLSKYEEKKIVVKYFFNTEKWRSPWKYILFLTSTWPSLFPLWTTTIQTHPQRDQILTIS